MRIRSNLPLAAWLVVLAAGQVAAFVAVWRFFVRTQRGQALDTIALTGNSIGQTRVDGVVSTVLDAMSLVSLVAATGIVVVIALMRRRLLLALVVGLLVGGANAMTQLLKQNLYRPDFGVDPDRAAAGNSFPSGHATVAASLAFALVLVLPPRVRGVGAMLGAGYAAVAGVATMSAGWHRPSDAIAALLIVGAWAAAAGVILALARPAGTVIEPAEGHPRVAAALVLGGLVLIGLGLVALRWTDQVLTLDPEQLSRQRLFGAYAGSAAGIAGTASLLMGLMLATVHRAVPTRSVVDEPPMALVAASP
jgi:membrane-associated phospholipid phosphatase